MKDLQSLLNGFLGQVQGGQSQGGQSQGGQLAGQGGQAQGNPLAGKLPGNLGQLAGAAGVGGLAH